MVEAVPNDEFFRGLAEQLEKVQQKSGETTKRELLETLALSPAVVQPPTGTSPAPVRPKAPLDGKKAKDPKANNNQAVKNFFRSLLTQSSKVAPDSRASKDKRAKAAKALQDLRTGAPGSPGEQPEEISSPPPGEDGTKKSTSPV